MLFYVFFPEFKREDEIVELVMYGERWPMQKIENVPAYFLVIELNTGIYNVSYHYEWNNERTYLITRNYIGGLNTIFDTPERFTNKKTKVDKSKLFLEVVRLYTQNVRVLPS